MHSEVRRTPKTHMRLVTTRSTHVPGHHLSIIPRVVAPEVSNDMLHPSYQAVCRLSACARQLLDVTVNRCSDCDSNADSTHQLHVDVSRALDIAAIELQIRDCGLRHAVGSTLGFAKRADCSRRSE